MLSFAPAVVVDCHNKNASLLQKLFTDSKTLATIDSKTSLDAKLSDSQRVAYEEKIADLVKNAVIGLGTVPSFQETALQTVVAAGGGETTAADVLTTKSLFVASEHLKKEVVMPMFELSQRLKFKIDSVQALFDAQFDLLNGS